MAVDLTRLRNLANTARSKAQQSKQHRDGRSWYRIENSAAGATNVYIYDMIGEWGVTADDLVSELRGIRNGSVNLHLNCEGGEVFDGLAIYESIRQHPARFTGNVEGIAASAASFILQACDHRVVARNARIMIHDAHGLTIGNAADMREMATLLDDLSDNIADIYAERSGTGDVKSWRKAMHGPNAASDGTWYNAADAVAAGLADEVASVPGREPENRATPQTTEPASGALAWNPNEFLSALGAAFTEEGVA